MKIKTNRSFISTVLSGITWRVLETLNKNHNKEKLPRLFCSPTDFLGKQIISNGLFEKETILLVERITLDLKKEINNKSVFVDIGANIGNHTCYLARHFEKVISFEPSPLISKILNANVLLNNLESQVTLIEKALSNEKNILEFYTNKGTDNLGGSSLIKERCINENGVKVEVEKGDNVLEELLIFDDKITLIKIDVEGHEFEVLQGLTRTINKHLPIIVFETENGEKTISCLNLLKSEGYSNFYEIKNDAYEGDSKTVRFFKRLIKLKKEIDLIKIINVEDKYYESIICIPPNLTESLLKLDYVPN